MTTFDQELTGRYVSAGATGHPRRSTSRPAAFVRDTVRTIYDADKKFGIDPPTSAASPSSSTPPKSTSSTSATTSARDQS